MIEKEENRQWKERFEDVFHGSMDVLMIIDVSKCMILKANKTCERILGFKPNELEGMPFSILFPEQEEKSVREMLEKLKIYGGVFTQEFRKAEEFSSPMDFNATIISWEGKDAFLVTLRDVSEREEAEREKNRLLSELQNALNKIKILSGLLPICASCKRIRDKKGNWHPVEVYVQKHSEAEFSHGICPDCAKKLYSKYT